MPTSPEYDAILARKIREREEGNKGEIIIIPPSTLPNPNLPLAMQNFCPKKRGRPKGSKNKPKVK